MLCYAMTISGIQTHYLRCSPVSTINRLKGLVLLPEELDAFKLYACRLIDQSRGRPVSLSRQEIVPMSSPALKSIYESAVYLFGYTTFPDL
jgi:hypothetical protein